ncbi:MAG TPA: TetR/AcrR family transcriptional regulator [Solirubrobacteraceae bacterium]|nr:TetR/AcrR family transcriptional regulator [Solirubrobacteraceae bacterium]
MDSNVSQRSPSSEETRARLLRAAAELIAELGWGRVTTRAVATRANLPHGAVSYHFRGKQELLTEAALDVFAQAFPASELESLAALPDIVALFEYWLGDQSPDGQLVSRVGVEAMLESERNPVLRDRMAEMLRDFRCAVARVAEAAQERGTMPATVSPEALAILLGAVGDGLFLHARLDPDLDAAGALSALQALLSR